MPEALRSSLQHRYKLLELFLLFIAVPTLYRLVLKNVFPIPFLLLFAALCLRCLWKDLSFNRTQFWTFAPLRPNYKYILTRFLAAALLLTLFVYFTKPDSLFRFPRLNTGTWFIVLSLYPLLSVIPQNIVYRAFFFQRYSMIFSGALSRILASSLAFSYVHIIYGNFLSLVLTFAGGLLFARTYEKTGSFWLASFEHALYGCWIFTVGLGPYFFHGSGA